MLADVLTMVWKEWKELLLSRGGIRGGLISTVGIPLGMLGIYLPWQNGPEWVTTPLLPVAWSWLPLLLVGALVADSFAGERERKTLETLLASRLSDRAILLGKIAALVGYGWGLALGSLVLGTITVNLAHRQDTMLLPSGNTVMVIVVFTFTSVAPSSGVVETTWRARGPGVGVGDGDGDGDGEGGGEPPPPNRALPSRPHPARNRQALARGATAMTRFTRRSPPAMVLFKC